MDTGADWSLLDAEKCNATGQGVSNFLKNRSRLWVRSGETSHCYIGRSQDPSAEIRGSKGNDHSCDIRSRLLGKNRSNDIGLQEKEVDGLKRSRDLPTISEKIVTARAGDHLEGRTILMEPAMEDERPCNIPFTVGRVKDSSVITRIANVSERAIKLEKDQLIAKADPSVSVVNRVRSEGSGGKELLDQFTVGHDLTSQKKTEMNALLATYKRIFHR